MQKTLITLILILAAKFTIAQGIEIVSVKKLKPLSKDKASAFIHPKTDTSSLQFIATCKATGQDSMILPGNLYLVLKTQSRALGANCLILRRFSYDSLKRPVIHIDAYYGTESFMAANNSNYETNEVFIFGSEKLSRDSFSLKVNNETKTFRSGTYLKFNLTKGETLKVNIGGFTGTTFKLKYAKERTPDYLMITSTGFTLGGGPLPPPGTIGITFNTGRINELNDDYGQFLIQILKRSE
jgi:hypothetical protein